MCVWGGGGGGGDRGCMCVCGGGDRGAVFRTLRIVILPLQKYDPPNNRAPDNFYSGFSIYHTKF